MLIRDILAIKPGVGMSTRDEWTYVGFKGGSSVGEPAGSWYVERSREIFHIEYPSHLTGPSRPHRHPGQVYFSQIEDS